MTKKLLLLALAAGAGYVVHSRLQNTKTYQDIRDFEEEQMDYKYTILARDLRRQIAIIKGEKTGNTLLAKQYLLKDLDYILSNPELDSYAKLFKNTLNQNGTYDINAVTNMIKTLSERYSFYDLEDMPSKIKQERLQISTMLHRIVREIANVDTQTLIKLEVLLDVLQEQVGQDNEDLVFWTQSYAGNKTADNIIDFIVDYLQTIRNVKISSETQLKLREVLGQNKATDSAYNIYYETLEFVMGLNDAQKSSMANALEYVDYHQKLQMMLNEDEFVVSDVHQEQIWKLLEPFIQNGAHQYFNDWEFKYPTAIEYLEKQLEALEYWLKAQPINDLEKEF